MSDNMAADGRDGDSVGRSPMPRSVGPHKWTPVALAAVLLVVVVGSGFVFASGPDDAYPSEPEATQRPVTVAVEPVPNSNASTVAPSEAADAEVKVPLTRTLHRGDSGDDVRRIQERLSQLPFDPGPIDGAYGQMTAQAVWAYEKIVLGIPREAMTGEVTPQMWDRMQEPVVIEPRRRTGPGTTHTEIYLVEQVVAVFDDDEPVLVTHASSGDGEEWCDTVTYDTDPYGNTLDEPVEREVCGISKTPGGVFSFNRKVDGIRESPLGSLWNPIYFNYGIAIHGAINVPSYPTSHGCVRIPMRISEYFQTLVDIGDQVFVWDGTTEPENLTERETLPVFDYPNPDATTTTTIPATTTVPATTTTPTTTTSTTTTTTKAETATTTTTLTTTTTTPAPP